MMNSPLFQVAVASPVVVNSEPVTDMFGGECTAPTLGPSSLLSCVNGVSWLGGEPNLLGVLEETEGVEEVLRFLTEEERNQIVQSDTTLPIRYFRGAKVSEE